MSQRLAILAAVLLAAPACTSEAESEMVPFSEGQAADTELGAFAVRAWTEDGEMGQSDSETCFFRVAMPTLDGDDGRGIPGATLELLAGPDLRSADLIDTTFTYEGDGVYRADGVEFASSDLVMHLEVSTVSVADSITYALR